MLDPIRHRTLTKLFGAERDTDKTAPKSTTKPDSKPVSRGPSQHAADGPKLLREPIARRRPRTPQTERHDRSSAPAPASNTPARSEAAASPSISRTAEGTKPSDEVRSLIDRAQRTRGGSWWNPRETRSHTWDPSSNDLTTARNAHRTNTSEEMHDELGAGFNWLEGDLRVDDHGTLVMAHDADQESKGLKLDEWLAVGKAGERGMKVDVKEDAAIPELLDSLEKSGIPDGRLMINVGDLPVEQVREIRDRFPDAWMALNPKIHEDGYHEADLARTAALADAAGGRVVFPIRWDQASDDVIAALKPHGKISIWTSTSQGTPDDAAAETQRLRDRGVDGVIDLGPPLSTKEQVLKRALDVWESDPVRGARDVAQTGVDIAESGLQTAGDIAGAGVDIAREGASHLPVVGGWFD